MGREQEALRRGGARRWPDNEKGREGSYGNTMGWTHMPCSLKAWLEHGVNLRDGAFLHCKF